MGFVFNSPFFVKTTAYPWVQNAPTYYTAASSGGQGNIAPNLILETTSSTVVRADGATTKANCAGVCTRVLDSNYKELPPGFVATNTTAKLEVVSFADLVAQKIQMVLGEDGDTTTLKTLIAASTITSTGFYVPIINETDITNRVGLPASQFVFKMKIDSSGANNTQSNMFLQVLGEFVGGNLIPLSNPTAADTAASSWVVQFVA